MQKDWVQHPPGVAVPYPVSGELIGHVAGFLRLKGYLREGWEGGTYKTAQRYFAGHRVEPSSVDQILDLLVAALLPADGASLGFAPEARRTWTRKFLAHALVGWDILAGSLRGGSFPIIEARLAPLPFLRLFTLDTAIRWAAFQALVTVDQEAPNLRPVALEEDGLRQVMDAERRNTAGETLTLERLAEELEITQHTMDAWRSGDQQPTDENIKFLAAALAGHSGRPAAAVEFDLRVATGLGALRRFLSNLCGKAVVEDLGATFSAVATLTYRWLRTSIPPAFFAPAMIEIIEHGARATVRERLCGHLADASAGHAEVRADFLALSGRWDGRITYWAKMMTAFDASGGFLNHLPDLLDEQKLALRPELEERALRMRFFETEEAAHPHLFRAPEDANTRAKREAIQGHRARSYGDIEKAAHHLRNALRHDPVSAAYRYGLGSYLGELVALGKLNYLDEALSECGKAARLDPTWNSPPTEIAILYSNVGMLEEALKAFADAEPVAQGWSHFHYTRGNTFLWLDRFDEAAASYRRALELEPERLGPLVNLAVALTCMGRHREVGKLATVIAHLGGPRYTRPEEWLAQFPPMTEVAIRLRGGRRRPASVEEHTESGRATTKTGRNEPCPCGSGQKFKRCCGRAA